MDKRKLNQEDMGSNKKIFKLSNQPEFNKKSANILKNYIINDDLINRILNTNIFTKLIGDISETIKNVNEVKDEKTFSYESTPNKFNIPVLNVDYSKNLDEIKSKNITINLVCNITQNEPLYYDSNVLLDKIELLCKKYSIKTTKAFNITKETLNEIKNNSINFIIQHSLNYDGIFPMLKINDNGENNYRSARELISNNSFTFFFACNGRSFNFITELSYIIDLPFINNLYICLSKYNKITICKPGEKLQYVSVENIINLFITNNYFWYFPKK